MSALKRVLQAPSTIVWVLLFQLVPTWMLGRFTRSGVNASLGGNALESPERMLASTFELFGTQSGLGGTLGAALVLLLVVTLVLWMVALGGVVGRLHGPLTAADMAGLGMARLPGLVSASAWHLVIRALLVFVPFVVARRALEGGAQSAALLLCFLLLGFSTCALDFARCRVVTAGQPGRHPRTILGSLKDPLRRPGALFASIFWGTLQWVCLLIMPWWTLNHLSDGNPIWVVRGLAVAAVVFGLTRLAVAVEAGAEDFAAQDTEPEDPVPATAATAATAVAAAFERQESEAAREEDSGLGEPVGAGLVGALQETDEPAESAAGEDQEEPAREAQIPEEPVLEEEPVSEEE